MSPSTTKQEADMIYGRYISAQARANEVEPLATFIVFMRGLGYSAMLSSLIFNLITIAQNEIRAEIKDDLMRCVIHGEQRVGV